MNKKDIVYVNLFADFEMRIGTTILKSDTLRSDMMCKLLIYILCHRKNPISIIELCEELWQNDESDNPAGALKNLLYRLRTALYETFNRKDFIITSRGAYSWNPDIHVNIDSEDFANSITEAMSIKTDNKIEYLTHAISLYRGDFLPQFMGEIWIMQQNVYYHSLFISCIKKLATIYKEQKDFEKLEVICNNALKFEELDESIHCHLLDALILQGKNNIALKHYKYTKDLLYTELGVSPSEKMQNIYKELLKELKNEQLDLGIVQEGLEKAEKDSGAYICEYGVFKEIYILQTRQAKRLGIAVHCGLITVEPLRKLPLGSTMYQKFEERTMEILKNVLLATLRSGDIITRYSATQYMLLLPTCDYEGGRNALERVKDNFYKIHTRQMAKLICDLKEMHLD